MLSLPLPALRTIQALAECYPGETWAGQSAEQHQIATTTVHSIVQRFVESGWAETRRQDRTSRGSRRLMVKMTDKGIAEYTKMRDVLYEAMGAPVQPKPEVRKTPYVETELLLSVIAEDWGRVNDMLRTLSRSQATHLAQQVKTLGTVLAVYGQGD